MSKRARRTVIGVGLTLGLALSATPAAQAAPGRGHRPTVAAARVARPTLLTILWSYLVGSDPHGPQTTQGPTVDPNGSNW